MSALVVSSEGLMQNTGRENWYDTQSQDVLQNRAASHINHQLVNIRLII